MTRLGAYVTEALEAIWRNRTRSLLTMLGMIIGTASIIAVLGVSKAASGGITSTLAAFGNPGISLSVDPDGPNPLAAAIDFRDARIIDEALHSKIRHIEPVYQRQFTLRAGAVSYSTFGLSDSEYHPDSIKLLAGRRIDAGDLRSGAHVCNVTRALAVRMFGSTDVLGSILHIGGSRCTVVGIYDEIKGGILLRPARTISSRCPLRCLPI